MTSTTPTLMLRTIMLPDGSYQSDWRTPERQGYVLTRPPNHRFRRAVAELLALHAVTGLVRPLRFRDFTERRPIRLSAPEIPETLSGSAEFSNLRQYVRFMRLSLNDLPIELMRIEDWPSPPLSAVMESLELVRHDPWDDVVHFSGQITAAPTIRVLDIIRAHLETTTQWKAWAALYLTVPNMIRLPSVESPAAESGVHHFVCPKYGWIFIIMNGRIVGIRAARAGEHRLIVSLLMGQRPAKDEKFLASAAIYAIATANSSVERLRILDEFLSILPGQLRRVLRDGNAHEHHSALSHVMKGALDKVADPAARASMLRMFLQSLPEEESHLVLPDGTRALVSGHALDRLMTRFNVQSALSGLRRLHESSRGLRATQLSASLIASKGLKYDTSAVHWRHLNKWTIVVSEGMVKTAYFPKGEC